MDLLRMGARLLLVVACRRLRLFGARAERDCPYGDVFGARAERDCPYGDVFFRRFRDMCQFFKLVREIS